MNLIACDVSQAVLTTYDGSKVFDVENSTTAIEELLKAHKDCTVVCEPTGRFHLLLVEAAIRGGHKIYLVNPREARNYKDSVSFRAKTDPLDARYLYEFVRRNEDLLRPYCAPAPELVELRSLLGKRQAAVETRTALSQSFGKVLSAKEKAVIDSLNELIKDLEDKMEEIAKKFDSYSIVRSIPGVGLISGCALTYVLELKPFDSSAALVAFLGLDVRIRQSGKYRGQEKLSKRGDPILRFLLCFAGRGLLNSLIAKGKREALTAKGRTFPERLAIAARKILRTAFALHKKNTTFDPKQWIWA
jgi:transposase